MCGLHNLIRCHQVTNFKMLGTVATTVATDTAAVADLHPVVAIAAAACVLAAVCFAFVIS